MQIRARLPVLFKAFHWLWLAVGLLLIISKGVRHDYWSYIVQWQLVLDGKDPWGPVSAEYGVNAYGPVHNLLAVFLPLHPLAPKVFIFAVFAVASTLLLYRLIRERGSDWNALALYVVAIPGNMLFTLFAFYFGSNDLLVAAFVIFAILARLDRHVWLAALWLGLAILLKFYPALFVPLFMIEKDRIDLRYGFYTAFVAIAGMAVAYAVWGGSVFEPFRFASERGLSFLSVFKPLAAWDSAVTGGVLVAPLLKYNSLMVLLVAAAAALFTWRRGFSWLSALVVVVLASLLTYKVGHQQFFMAWACAVGCLLLINTAEADSIARAAIPYLLFLSAFSFLHVKFDPLVFENVEIWAYISFPLGVLSLVLMLRVRPSPNREVAAPTDRVQDDFARR